MAAQIPSAGATPQFLFTADSASSFIAGYRIARDGSLSPVPGSPFADGGHPKAITSIRGTLIVAGDKTLRAFLVDKETGSIRQTDSVPGLMVSRLVPDSSMEIVNGLSGKRKVSLRVVDGKLQLLSTSATEERDSPLGDGAGKSALDASGRFFYVLDSETAQISAYRVHGSSLNPLVPATYPVGRGTASLTVVTP